MCHTSRTRVNDDGGAVGTIRDWLHEAVVVDYADGAELADDAVTVVSELVSNALEAGASDIVVTATCHRTAVTVEVADDAPGMPHQRPIRVDSTSGRGLLIVAALSSRWGVERTAGGKTVWADVAVAAAVARALPCLRTGAIQ